jgi:hypothetical protein
MNVHANSPLFISPRDYRDLLMTVVRLRARVSRLLISELQRASVTDQVDDDVVAMGRVVRFYPEEVASGKVSVTSPLGAALLGLKSGSSLSFQERTVTVRSVEKPLPVQGRSRRRKSPAARRKMWRRIISLVRNSHRG